MPPLAYSDCRTPAVYWPQAGYGNDGLPYVLADTFEEIKVSWTQRLRTGTDPKGNAVTTTVTIGALRIVDGLSCRLALDSFIWLGKVEDFTGTASEPVPLADPDRLWQVVTEDVADDFRGRTTRYEYGLMRFSDRLPVL